MVNQLSHASKVAAHHGATVPLSDIFGAGLRLDAAAHSIEAREARGELAAGPYPLIPILSSSPGGAALGTFATNGRRFSRTYVEEPFGVPFLSSADIIAIAPPRDAFISRALTPHLDELKVRPWDVLISRSGTIGNVALAPPSWHEFALSEDAIRLRANDADTAGFLACFLRSRWGRAQLVGHSYGSVITHIETHHLPSILAPSLPPILRIEIGRAFVEAAKARDAANAKMKEAERELLERLRLSKIDSYLRGPIISAVRASELTGRFEASYHDPHVRALLEALQNAPYAVKDIRDPSLGLEVRAVTKFRKRIYVEHGGIPMLSSKQLFQVDPIDVKRLARGAHLDDLPEIELTENMLCITRSGTIGRVFMVPEYMAGWTANEHSIRLVGGDQYTNAYVYAWLASSLGHLLIIRERYGSVIQELDRFQLAKLQIPWLPQVKDRLTVAEPILIANQLRTAAWKNERQALERLSEVVAGGALASKDV